MSWRHHDSSVADVFPSPSEYNAADVATLLEVPIQLHKPYNSLLYVAGLSPTWKGLGYVPVMKGPGGKVLTMAEFLRLPDLGVCKIVAGTLLPPNFPVDSHLSNPAARLEDIPPKTPAMERAEVACPKVIAAREKKKQRAEDLLASKAVGGGKVGPKRRVGQEGTSKKKRKTLADGPSGSKSVSSPRPLNQVVPTQPLVTEPVHEPSFSHDDGGNGPNDDGRGEAERVREMEVGLREGRGENDGQCASQRPSVHHTGGEKIISSGESIFLPFLSLLCGLTDSDRMVKFRHCRDMMSNIFTLADLAFFNEGMDDREAESDKLQESCDLAQTKYAGCKKKLADLQVAFDAKVSDYGQLSHDYEDALRREEALKVKVAELEAGKKESDELVVSQAERIKSLEVALKESETGVEQLRSDREKFAVAAGKGEMIRKRLITEYFPTFVQRLLQSKEYKESVGEVLSLAVGKGFIDGISLGRTKADVDALLKASPGVNPASSDLFMGEYLKLFEMHYPYVDKVTRAYLLDPSELQNVMQDGTGPTPGGGPRPSSTAHS
ncbi:hypothetical protein Tco_0185982 [Tanacetum coccineum]